MKEEEYRRMELRRENGTRKIIKPVSSTVNRGPEYLIPFACFVCRKSFKKPVPDGEYEHSCSECDSPMYEMGRNFSAPKKEDHKQWRKVQLLYAHGFRFVGSGNHNGPNIPKTLADVELFLPQGKTPHKLRLNLALGKNRGTSSCMN